MVLTDFHVHSDVSTDSKASMQEMAAAEAAAGVRLMCFTNHCDMETRSFAPNPWRDITVPESFRKAAELVAPPLEVRIGIELAEAPFAPEQAMAIAATPGLDFVIGSLHILPELGDLCSLQYTDIAYCDRIFDLYLDEVQRVAELDFYDVIAHIGYGRRYMWRQGVDAMMTLAKFGEKIERLLRTVIDKGKGIEINCSGLRDGCGPFPQPEILRLYRALGGEIVTVGSDAHKPADAGKGVAEGCDVLRECGFQYVTAFRARKPEFMKL